MRVRDAAIAGLDAEPRDAAAGGGRRVGLIVVHGMGEQKPGTSARSIVRGLETAYGEGSFVAGCSRPSGGGRGSVVFTLPAGTGGAPVPEVRVYEAHWAQVLSGDAVRGSFHIRLPQQFLWFPLLNRRYSRSFAAEYPAWVVWRWTLILLPLAIVLAAAYRGATALLSALQFLLDRPREMEVLDRAAARARGPAARLLEALQKKPPTGDRRDLLERYLDDSVGDIFNYIASAGGADAAVPDAERRIQAVFRAALETAIRDGCTEVQVLGHSLGTVIVYRALTRYRRSTEELVCLDRTRTDLPRLTHVYTIGSPLEKIRFFWPKLIESSPPASFEWHNFRCAADPVAGVIKRFDLVDSVANHSVAGAGGLWSAHRGYRAHPSFVGIFGPAVTDRRCRLPVGRFQPRKWLGNLGQLLAVPLALVALAVLGAGVMFGQGFLAGLALQWLAAESLGPSPTAPLAQLIGRLPWVVGALFPTILILVAPADYRRARETHLRFWRHGYTLERRRTMASADETRAAAGPAAQTERVSPYRKPSNYGLLLGHVAILAVIGWVGWNAGAERRFSRPEAWLLILLLMAAFAVLAGRGITGYWRGILIDQRYKMSLSRLQLLVWTLIVLSAIVTAVLTNIALGSNSPLAIEIPDEIWVLLGISLASSVGGPALLGNKRKREPDTSELRKTAEALESKAGVEIDAERSGTVIYNCSPGDARWGDLLKGDEVGNATTVDLGKLQMFFFTFVLALGYGAAVATLLEGSTLVGALPPVDDSMNTLLGISHTGYLANKTVSHSRAPDDPTADPTRRRAGTKRKPRRDPSPKRENEP